jgi:hypothetical protein
MCEQPRSATATSNVYPEQSALFGLVSRNREQTSPSSTNLTPHKSAGRKPGDFYDKRQSQFVGDQFNSDSTGSINFCVCTN